MKAGAFRLNMHPKAYFDEKPYTSDKPMPPPKKAAPKKPIPTPFKPSHPPKAVSTCCLPFPGDRRDVALS